jgi:DNA-binding GntR family transcriptional regulator
MRFTFEEFVDEIEDFNNVLDAFEKRDADKAAKALENHMDRFVIKSKGSHPVSYIQHTG